MCTVLCSSHPNLVFLTGHWLCACMLGVQVSENPSPLFCCGMKVGCVPTNCGNGVELFDVLSLY